MNWRQIETAREIRMWIRQIIAPAAIIAATVLSIPEYKQAVIDLGNHIRRKITDKKKQKERP